MVIIVFAFDNHGLMASQIWMFSFDDWLSAQKHSIIMAPIITTVHDLCWSRQENYGRTFDQV